MSIETDNLKFKKIQVNPAGVQTAAGNASVSSDIQKSKPIDFKAQDSKVEENAKKIDSEIVKFVNSDEFKAMAPETQAKVLKERFMPNATLEDINKTISLAKQSVQTSIEDSTETEENLTYKLSGKESDVEKAAYAYIEKNGLKDVNIDKLRSILANKVTRSPEEEALFNQIQGTSGNTDKNPEPLLSAEEMLSEDWMKKNPIEKFGILADKYLKKTDEKYNNLSENQKREYVKENIDNLALSLSDNSRKELTVGDYTKVPELLEALNQAGMSIDDYNKLSKSDQRELYRTHQKNTMKELKNLVSDEVRQSADWQNKSADEKLMVYADAFLEKNDPNYKKLSPEEQEEYIKAKSNEMISRFVPDWQNKDAESKEAILTDTIITVDAIIENNVSFDEFQNMSFDKKLELKTSYKATHGYPATKLDSVQQQIVTDYVQKNGKSPTVDDIINEIKANNVLSDADKQKILKSLEFQKMLNDGKNVKINSHPSYQDIACLQKTTVEQVINNDFQRLKNAKPEKQTKILKFMFCKTHGDVELIEKLKAQALEYGFSEEQINATCKESKVHHDALVRAIRNNDGDAFGKGFDMSANLGDKKSCKVAAYNLPRVLDGEAKEVSAVNIVNNHQNYVTDMAKGINDFEQEPVKFAKSLLTREDVSDAGKAVFTKSVIETSPTPQRQLEYGKTFSQIDNPAVTEGLAAASNSVDSSVRTQYNSYVDSAAKNYSLEQQATIRSAQQSGEVSKPTLAQTTPAAVSSAENSGSQTSQVQSSQAPSKSSTVAKSTSSAPTSGRTIVSSNPTSASSVLKATVQSGRTKVDQNVEASYETKVMQQKKEALLDKIVSYETTKNKSAENVEKTVQSEEIKTEAANIEEKEIPLSEDEQEVLKQMIEELFQKNTLTAAYSKLADALGEAGKDRFLEVFATKGREMDVRSFAQNYRGDSDTILKLFDYCQSESLRFDLLKLLPSNSIAELVSTQKISSTDFERLIRENKVESNVILDYINKNKGSMSVQEMKKYLSFLSLADRNALFEILKNTKGSDEWLQAQQDNMRTVATDTPDFTSNSEGLSGDTIPTLDDGISIGSNKVSMRGQYNKMKKRGPFFLNA